MLSLSAAAILEKNKLANAEPFVVLCKLALSDGRLLYLAANNADVAWDGLTWLAFPFELDTVVSSVRGQLPSVVLRVSNVTRIVEGYMAEVDGGVGSTVTLYVVHAAHLDQTTPELEETFDIVASGADATWVTLTLGAPNPLARRFPLNRFMRDHCRWVYKSAGCGYTGALATCEHTLTDCRVHANAGRFGGFPGIPGGALYKL